MLSLYVYSLAKNTDIFLLFVSIFIVFLTGFVNYKKGCTRLAAASDKVYQLLAHGQWFSPGTPASSASSTTKTGRHDIHVAEILLQVALNTKNQSIKSFRLHWWCNGEPARLECECDRS